MTTSRSFRRRHNPGTAKKARKAERQAIATKRTSAAARRVINLDALRAATAVALLVLISGCSVTGGSGIGGTIDDGGFLDRAVNGDRRRVKADIEVPAGDSYTLHVTGGGGANNATSINTGGGDGQGGR